LTAVRIIVYGFKIVFIRTVKSCLYVILFFLIISETVSRSSNAALSDRLHHLLETPLAGSSRPSRTRMSRAMARESISASSQSSHAAHQTLDSQIP